MAKPGDLLEDVGRRFMIKRASLNSTVILKRRSNSADCFFASWHLIATPQPGLLACTSIVNFKKNGMVFISENTPVYTSWRHGSRTVLLATYSLDLNSIKSFGFAQHIGYLVHPNFDDMLGNDNLASSLLFFGVL